MEGSYNVKRNRVVYARLQIEVTDEGRFTSLADQIRVGDGINPDGAIEPMVQSWPDDQIVLNLTSRAVNNAPVGFKIVNSQPVPAPADWADIDRTIEGA